MPDNLQTCDLDATITVLLAEDDVLVRIAIADYLRACGFRVIEASGGLEAKTVLQHGPHIDVLFADARLAGDDNGFALARWARRNRPDMKVRLSVSLSQKSETAASMCAGHRKQSPPSSHLRERIESMKARHIRRVRPEIGAARAHAGLRWRVS